MSAWRIWWADIGSRPVSIHSEKDLRAKAKQYGFDADEVLKYGQCYIWETWATPNDDPSSEEYCGGCIEVKP